MLPTISGIRDRAARRLLPRWAILGSMLSLALLAGCICSSKNPGSAATASAAGCDSPCESQIERGKPRPLLDAVGWVVGVPSKLVMLNHRVNNHNVSAPTEEAMRDYLDRNCLDTVKVRINQYDPCGEWQRLKQNETVAWPVRYTFGTLSVVGYTLLPGRVFGGDHYNPFTNTISIYSDVPSMAVFEGGHALDYAHRDSKGLYAVVMAVPGVNAIHETRAAGNAIDYIRLNGTPEERKEGYRTVYPAYALSATGPISSFTGLPIWLPAVAAGHVAGQVTATQVPPQNQSDTVIASSVLQQPRPSTQLVAGSGDHATTGDGSELPR